MNKNYVLVVITFLCAFLSAFGQVSDLIISEYGEGSFGNSKYVEIYNGTGAAVDLSDYQIWRVSNGGTWVTNPDNFFLPLSGTLADGATYVIAHNATNVPGADLYDTIASWNGDDAVGLAKDIAGTFTLIDAVGTDGPDPGAGWDVAGVTNATANHKLTRKANVCNPNTNWTASAGTNATDSEWIDSGAYVSGSANAGHTSVCTDTYVKFVNTASTITEDGVFVDICVSILNPSGSTATTVDIILNGSSTATNGTDYDDGAGPPAAISFPQTLTFPAGSSANQCLTIYISNDDIIYEGDETVVLDLNNPAGGTSASLTSNSQHVLTILDNETPVIADVIITEIMFNTSGLDDEWIEICNTTGISQVLNDYTIEVDGSTEFTFPLTGVSIAPGNCITIALGNDGDAEFNDGNGSLGYCPFVPDYANSNGPGTLANTSATITIVASDGSTVVDTVDYTAADGGAGNGSSLHVTDDSIDNSDTGTNWQEVIDGGSPGLNTLISQCSSLQPEINVEGDINTYPNISDNDLTPSYFDNTKFSNIDIAGASETKSFRIQNIGTADLTVSNIQIVGANPGDFSLTLPSGLPIVIEDISTMTNLEVFDITFDPVAAGLRTAIVRITNDDTTDSEDIYEFAIEGEGFCTTATNVVTPLSGPDNTVVTITGSDLDGSTSVTFAGSIIAHTVISPTEIEITIPDDSVSGNIAVTNNIGCQTTDLFTVFNNAISSCEGSTGLTPTDLFISEITDAPTGAHTYIEIFNGTGAPVNLADYEIRVHNNGSNNAGGAILDLSAAYTMPNNSVYVVAIGGTNATDPEGGYTADEFSGMSAVDSNDNIRLYKNDGTTDTWIDVWGDLTGSNFTAAPKGYTYRRKNTGITVPRTNDWDGPLAADDMNLDWDAYSSVVYDDIGTFDFSTGAPPIITDEPDPVASTCNLTASFTLEAEEGYVGGLALAYQWFVSVPGIDGWSALSNNATYSGVNTDTLDVLNTIGLYNYQYYCQVRENLNTCYTASHAVRITTPSTTWVSPGTWDSGAPDINTITVLDYNYNTSVSGSFSACRLFVNATNLLTISNNTFVEVENDLTVNGNIVVQTDGSFVQNSDVAIVDGAVTGDKTRISVIKETAILNSPQEYTYWSSPVLGETITDGLSESAAQRRFWFNGQNFRDSTRESNNDNATVAGQDDIDDDANDWQFANGASTMLPGVGYAATHSEVGYIGPGNQYLYTFEGPFNNGIYNIPIYRNDAETNDNNWNFIGNPYPSAIHADLFLAANGSIDQTVGATNGAIFFWSHNTGADANTNGNEVLNYAQSDYAIINGTGETAGGDMVTPDRYIPSGQGFFVSMSNAAPSSVVSGTVRTTDVVFNNSMRVTGNNAQFFRTSNSALPNKLKLDLTSDNGIFNQILIGYVAGATNDDDGMYYDARKNLSSNSNTLLYSLLDTNSTKKFAIQGKAPSDLSLEEIIPLGFYTKIDEPTIYKISIADLEGEFMTANSIYIKDKLLNSMHNLSESDYNFTSETGEFNSRFEIVFQSDALSTGENEISTNQLTIIELQNGNVKFSVGNSLTINTIEIIDLLGRTLYHLKGTNATEIFELNNLSQTVYIAKVTLSNGQTIIKRALKRN